MDLPATDAEQLINNFEDKKECGPSYSCDLCDVDVARKIADSFLAGLATACVDGTTGDLFRSPASVAVEFRKEMVDYLTQRSQNFVAESLIAGNAPDGEVSGHPFDIISNFVDDFTILKRSFLGRVSGWLLSESREDKIDDLVQEIDLNGFWPPDRRESVAKTLLINVDLKGIYHCNKKFKSSEELRGHVHRCGFRVLNCTNEGCTSTFIANHMEKHDLVCQFKIIPCEQRCSAGLMRREMDRHCITVCPMKLVNCPFYPVGCQTPVPHCMIGKHCSENLQSHLVCILQGIYKEASIDDLKRRAKEVEKLSSCGQLSEAQNNARYLTNAVKRLDAKLAPLEAKIVEKDTDESTGNTNTSQESELVETTKESQESEPTENISSQELELVGTTVLLKESEPVETMNKSQESEPDENTEKSLESEAV